MLQRFDGAHGSSGQLGHRFDREIRDEPQHDNFALIGRERIESIDQTGIERLARCLGDRYQMGAQESPLSGEASTLVDEAVMRDREHPSAKGAPVASKAVESLRHVAEHLAEQILAVDGAGGAQVGMHGTGQLAKDRLDRRRRSLGIVNGRVGQDRHRCCVLGEVHE